MNEFITSFLTSNFVTNVLPILASIAICVCYIPQIRMTYKTKNVEGMALGFWVALVFALSCYVLTASSSIVMGTGSPRFLMSQILNLMFAVVLLIMVLKYRQPKNKDEQKQGI